MKIISWNSSTLATSCEELTHWKRLWCWERLEAGEGDDRGWDGWMVSPTRGTWVWVHSGSWWWTGTPGVLWFMGSQRVGHDWATALNWTELKSLQTVPVGSAVKKLPANAGDAETIPASGRPSGEGNGNPLQYSCLRNPMDRRAWWATVHGIAKRQTWLGRHWCTGTWLLGLSTYKVYCSTSFL